MSDAARYLLQPSAYWSAEWWRLEQSTLFASTWRLAGHLSELSVPGATLGMEIGGERHLVARDHEGGLLVTTPVPSPAATRAADPVRVECWEGLVWCTSDPGAPALADWLAGVSEHLEGYQPSLLVAAGRARVRSKSNWKLFVENHVDVLHLWYLHSTTVPGAHQQFEWTSVGPHWMSWEPLREGAERKARFTRPISHVTGKRGPGGIGAHLIFPNIVFVTGRDSVLLSTVRPVGPETSELDILVLCEPGAEPTEEGNALRRRTPGGVLDEDLTACEGMQSAIRSSRFLVGPLAQGHELPVTRFQEALLVAVRAGDPAYSRARSAAAENHLATAAAVAAS